MKSFSIHFGLILKEYYCSKCGSALEKERTHRVVSRDDQDYYKYHKRGSFPRHDHDVYDYRLKCPSCQARISCGEQRIIDIIQKKRGHKVLSSNEIKDNYKVCKQENRKRVLYGKLAMTVAFNILAVIIMYFFTSERSLADLGALTIIFGVLTAFEIVGVMKKHKGGYKSKFKDGYSYEKEAQLNKLQAYSSHNRAMVEASERCYCYYCKSSMESGEIVEYSDEGQTAKCPNCGSETVIPDGIDEHVDEKIISEMNQYWF